MKTMEIYFGDLTEEAQQTFREIFGEPEEMNLNTSPLFIYEQEENTKEYCVFAKNKGDCRACSLVNYNRDCRNEPI